MSAEDITEFVQVFLDEIFDSVVDVHDQTHIAIGQSIYKLFLEIQAKQYFLYEELVQKYSKPVEFQASNEEAKSIHGDGSSHSSSDGEEDSEGSSSDPQLKGKKGNKKDKNTKEVLPIKEKEGIELVISLRGGQAEEEKEKDGRSRV